MSFDVVGFGALNLDKLYYVKEIIKEDGESIITNLKESAGGSAANTIVGLSRLGLKTGFIGKVASDYEGKLLLDEFRKEKVNIKGITKSNKDRSGIVLGFEDKKGNRILYIYPGVNDFIEFKDIELDYANNTQFLHISSFAGKKSFTTQKKLVKLLSDVKISFDPGDLYARIGLEALKPIIRRSYVMFPNAKEVKMLTGQDYEEGAKIFIEEGVDIVAVKLGKEGCYVTDRNESHLIEPYKVKDVYPTGAGDAFCAGFLFGLVKERSLFDCGRIGNFVASRCISEKGARNGLPRLEDLKNL